MVVISATVAPGCINRVWWMFMMCSPRMMASLLKAKLSSVLVTGPSSEFSVATTP